MRRNDDTGIMHGAAVETAPAGAARGYSDEEKARVMRQSRELLEELEGSRQRRAEAAPPVALPDPIETWKREAEATEQRRAHARAERSAHDLEARIMRRSEERRV